MKIKQMVSCLCIGMMLLGTTGCGNAGNTDTKTEVRPSDMGTEYTDIKETEQDDIEKNVLVAYFSCTGTTKTVAEEISAILGADLYEIVPEETYTDEDLNYGDDSSRTSREQKDETSRPKISGQVEHIEDYEVIFLGYPIWWGKAPHIMRTFVETYDLSGKEIIPFCTSGSSGIGDSAEELAELCPENVQWREGQRFDGNHSKEEVEEWIAGLNVRR